MGSNSSKQKELVFVPQPTGWDGSKTQIAAMNVESILHISGAAHESATRGLRVAAITFVPNLLRYAVRGTPRSTQQYADMTVHLMFSADIYDTAGPYETHIQNRWPPEYDLKATLNAIGGQGWRITAAFGTEPLVLILQRKVGDVLRVKEYNYLHCPPTLAAGVAHVHDHNTASRGYFSHLQATLDEENRHGWRIACVWQHDEQEPAALLMERDIPREHFYQSHVLHQKIPVTLRSDGKWCADFSVLDEVFRVGSAAGWVPAGTLTLPRVRGKGAHGRAVVEVLVILQARVGWNVHEDIEHERLTDPRN